MEEALQHSPVKLEFSRWDMLGGMLTSVQYITTQGKVFHIGHYKLQGADICLYLSPRVIDALHEAPDEIKTEADLYKFLSDIGHVRLLVPKPEAMQRMIDFEDLSDICLVNYEGNDKKRLRYAGLKTLKQESAKLLRLLIKDLYKGHNAYMSVCNVQGSVSPDNVLDFMQFGIATVKLHEAGQSAQELRKQIESLCLGSLSSAFLEAMEARYQEATSSLGIHLAQQARLPEPTL